MKEQYTVDGVDWTGEILEDIGHYLETEEELLPPTKPIIEVSVKIVERDSRKD